MRKLVLVSLFLCPALAMAMTDKQKYTSLKGSELSVIYSGDDGSALLGVGVFQKADNTVICLKSSPVVPNPVANYSCYKALVTNSAEQIYKALDSSELNVQFTDLKGNMLIGSSTHEKSDGNIFCRKTGAVVPNPEYNYTCYVR